MSSKPPLDIEEAFFEIDAVRWKRLLPWLRFGEVIRLSLDPRKAILGLAGIAAYLGLLTLAAYLPFVSANDTHFSLAPPPETPAFSAPLGSSTANATSTTIKTIFGNVAAPIIDFVESTSTAGVADAVTRLLIALIVWALFGGAIARIAALQFAGDHSTSIASALRFAARHILAGVGGTALPVIGIFVIWGLLTLGGLIASIPVVGPPVGGVFWGLALLFGFVAVVFAVGAAFGWPIMIAGTAVEGTDSFDALSRGFSYLFSRPVYLAFLCSAAVLFGAALCWFVAAGAGLTVQATDRLFTTPGEPFWNTPGFAANARSFWIGLVGAGVQGFAIAYFWTAVTVIYFLLRLSVDAMPTDRIYIPEQSDDDDLAPLVGVAAAERREAARETAAQEEQSAEQAADRDTTDADETEDA